ncbi:hypothetical protein AGIG_G17566 [Arapaima gigas]
MENKRGDGEEAGKGRDAVKLRRADTQECQPDTKRVRLGDVDEGGRAAETGLQGDMGTQAAGDGAATFPRLRIINIGQTTLP